MFRCAWYPWKTGEPGVFHPSAALGCGARGVSVSASSLTERRCSGALMVPTAAIRNLIREDKIHQIYSQMQVGQTKYGMQTMNQSLHFLFATGEITLEDAMAHSNDIDELRTMIANG